MSLRDLRRRSKPTPIVGRRLCQFSPRAAFHAAASSKGARKPGARPRDGVTSADCRAGATILSAFGGEVEKALGDRRGRPTWRSIANNWRRITRLDRPVPLSTAPSSSRGSLARHRGFRLASNHPSAQATPPGNSGGVFAFARSKSDATTLFGAGAQCPRRARHGAQNGPARAFKCPERTPATSRAVSGFPRGYISPNFKVLTSNIPAREHRTPTHGRRERY